MEAYKRLPVCVVCRCRGQLKLGDFGLARFYHAEDKR